jgi:hypothetical protein
MPIHADYRMLMQRGNTAGPTPQLSRKCPHVDEISDALISVQAFQQAGRYECR